MKIFVFNSWIKIYSLFSLLRPHIKFVTIIFQWLVFINITVNVFDCGTTSTRAILRYNSNPVLAVGWGTNRPPSPLNSVYFVQILQLNVEFWKSYFCSVSSYKVKKLLIEIVKNMTTFPFCSDRSITNMQICKILQNLVCKKLKNCLNKVGSRTVCLGLDSLMTSLI